MLEGRTFHEAFGEYKRKYNQVFVVSYSIPN